MVCWKSGCSVVFPALSEGGSGITWAGTQEQASGMRMGRGTMAVMRSSSGWARGALLPLVHYLKAITGADRDLERAAQI